MAFTIDSLPKAIQEILFSDEYLRFLFLLQERFNFSGDNERILDTLIYELFAKTIEPEQLEKIIKERLGFDDAKTRDLAKELVLNIVIPFTPYFGDYTPYYQSLGGDVEKDLQRSPVMVALFKRINDLMAQQVAVLDAFNWEREADGMREMFAKELVENFYAPDGDYKVRLNDTILALLRLYDAYNEKLLGALYENAQEIGKHEITLADGMAQRPTVANWIKDFLGFSGGAVSSIALAKYVSENKNAGALEAHDKDAVRRLLETFIVLKNFPESLDTMPEDQWKIIPYYHTEEVSKLPQAQRVGSGTDFAVAKTEPDPKLSQTPVPTITIVEATPVAVATAQPVEPLKAVVVSSSVTESVGIPASAGMTNISDAVLQKCGVILSDDIRERVKKIVETRVRSVRNDVDTRGRLSAVVAEGGAGLGAEESEKVMKEIGNALKAIAEGRVDEYAPEKMEDKGAHNDSLDSRLRGNDKEGGNDRGGLDDKESAERRAQSDEGDPVPKMVIKEVGGVPMIVQTGESKKPQNGKKKERGNNDSLDPRLRGDDKDGGDDKERGNATVPTASPTDVSPLVTPPPAPEPIKVPPHLEGAKDIPVVVKTSGAGLDPGRSLSRVSPRDRDDKNVSGDDKGGARNEKGGVAAGKAVGATKKPISDVRAAPRLVSIIDELRALTIKDIRRISQDPNSACQKIADKINALAKESLSKRAEAVNAWKESPAYALYIEIGQLNLSQDMAKLAEERKAAGKEYLTSEEFDALLDMNEKLRF